MAEKVIIEIEASTKEAQKNLDNLSKSFEDVYGEVKPLTNRVGELEDRLYEMAQAGDTASEEFKQLTKEASRLKTAQKEVDEIMDRSSMTLSQKVSTGLSTVASGAVLATSTMQEFGVIGEDSAETVNRAIGALSLVEFAKGLNDSTGLFSKLGKKIKSYTVVQKIATWAQRMWNLAMAANPLMTIVVAITAVIAAGYALVKMFGDSAEESEKNTKAIEAQTKAIEKQSKANQKRVDELKRSITQEQELLKAQGAEKEILRKKEREGLSELFKETQKLRNQANEDLQDSLFEERYLAEQGMDNELEAQKKQTEKLIGIRDKKQKDVETSLEALNGLSHKYRIEDIKSQNQDTEKEETNRKNKIEKQKELNNILRKLQIENIEDEQERVLEAFEFDAELQRKKLVSEGANRELLLEFDRSTQRKRRKIIKEEEAKVAEEIRTTLIDTEAEKREEEKRLLEKSYNEKLELAMKYYSADSKQAKELEAAKKTALDNQQKKFKEEDAKKAAEESAKAAEKLVLKQESELLSFEKQRELIKEREELLLADKTINYDDRVTLEKEFKAAKIKLDELEAQAAKEKSEKTEQGLNQLSELVGKNTVAGKGMSIAAATINTYQGVTDALAAKTITPFETALKFVNAGAILANGLKTVKQMAAVKIPNASGGAGTGGASSPSGGSVSQPPAFNVVGASGTSQLADAIGSQSQQPTRAYVVSNDVTTAQSMDRNIVDGASI